MNSKRKSENTSRQMTVKTQPYKMYGKQKSSSKREVHSNICLPPETNKQKETQIEKSNLPPKIIGKRTNRA